MTETTFMKNLKKWFWTFLLGQLAVVVLAGSVFYGSITTTVGQHAKDIESLKNSKADLNTVMRIKSDIDQRNEMILDELKSIKDNQCQIYNLLITHTENHSKK